jgi:hypothetical protein
LRTLLGMPPSRVPAPGSVTGIVNELDLAMAIAAASQPRSCNCGRVFIGSAFDVHREYGNGRCLPDQRLEGEGLVLIDGAWMTRAQAAAR